MSGRTDDTADSVDEGEGVRAATMEPVNLADGELEDVKRGTVLLAPNRLRARRRLPAAHEGGCARFPVFTSQGLTDGGLWCSFVPHSRHLALQRRGAVRARQDEHQAGRVIVDCHQGGLRRWAMLCEAGVQVASRLNILQIHSDAEAQELVALCKADGCLKLWAQPVPPLNAAQAETDEALELVPLPSVLFTFVRGLQQDLTMLRHLNLSHSPLAGEGFKALLQALRDSTPPLHELVLDYVQIDRFQLVQRELRCHDTVDHQSLYS